MVLPSSGMQTASPLYIGVSLIFVLATSPTREANSSASPNLAIYIEEHNVLVPDRDSTMKKPDLLR